MPDDTGNAHLVHAYLPKGDRRKLLARLQLVRSRLGDAERLLAAVPRGRMLGSLIPQDLAVARSIIDKVYEQLVFTEGDVPCS